MTYIFTKKESEKLEKRIRRTEKEIGKILKKKGEIAGWSAGDRWHSAEFMAAYVEEVEMRKRLSDLKGLASNAKIVTLKEQNEKVGIGNGVVIEYEDGAREKFVLEGYIVGDIKNRISIYSPLGKALKGVKKGEEKVVEIAGQKKRFKIIEILPPSKAKGIK